jgi:hypothetical protein
MANRGIQDLSHPLQKRVNALREVTQADLDCIEIQLGRTPRDVHAIAYRCPCGKPAVVETPPRLADGTPFPTFYYATCPRLTAAISTLETTGLMGQMNERLETDAELAGAYHAAHDDYIAARSALGIDVAEMPAFTYCPLTFSWPRCEPIRR